LAEDPLMFENVVKPAVPVRKFACPCCGFLTLSERGIFIVCPVCYWKDDGQDDHDSHEVRDSNLVSLAAARLDFKAIGASDLLWIGEVRPPTKDEVS
jgi:hypothetical protein